MRGFQKDIYEKRENGIYFPKNDIFSSDKIHDIIKHTLLNLYQTCGKILADTDKCRFSGLF